MTPSQLKKHTPAVKQALVSFLQTLLGEEAPLELDPPMEVDYADLLAETPAYITLRPADDAPIDFAVLLDPGWLPQLSEPMLGEALKVDDEGADDLLRELASQAYGSIRTVLAQEGTAPPDVTFEAFLPGGPMPQGSLPDTLHQITFSLRAGDAPLGGFVVLPAGAPPPPNPPAPDLAPPMPQQASNAPQVDVTRAAFPDLGDERIGDGGGPGGNFDLLSEVEMEVTVELGRRRLPLADLLRLTTGSVIELEKLVGEPLEIYANGRFIAEGEAVVIDEQFGIRITRLASARQREKVFR